MFRAIGFRTVLALLSACWAAFSAASAVAVPSQIPYVGHLSLDSGIGFEGYVSLQLTLYATENPTVGVDTPVWGPVSYGDVYVSRGILSAKLGSAAAPLDSALLDQAELWLLIELDSVAMSPLQHVLSVPYAMRAGDSERLGGLEPEYYLTQPDLGDLGYETTTELGDTFAPKSTQTDLSALEQTVAALSAQLQSMQGTIDDLQTCCEVATGPCAGLADGTPCDDGDACTAPDTCQGQLCTTSPADCDDNDVCTIDSCDSATGCIHDPSTDPACQGTPGVEEIFSARSHVNVARLDQQHLVVMWGIETDTSEPHTGFYAQVWRRQAGAWVKGTPLWVNHALLPVGSDNALALAGGIGSNHALVMVTDNSTGSYKRDLLLLKRTDLTLSWVGTYPQTAAFFMGHPIDDTRYLIKYRYSDSGQPVHYRVVSRSGDGLSFGTELQRPAPGSFPSGAASSEPQTYDPLVRIGTNQFREIRGGYVWASNLQSSFIITVSGTSLSASGLITHNSAPKAMSALAVGNGTGGVAMLYESYSAGSHAATMSGTSFAALGSITGSAGTSIQAAGYDSTDGYYNSKYWVRTRSGELYRFDAHGSVPFQVATGLAWHNCYTAPAILRIANEAFFVVSSGSTPMTLNTLNLNSL